MLLRKLSDVSGCATNMRVRTGAGGVKLTVGFLDNPPQDSRKRILLHMNACAHTANVQFVESKSSPQVRIARIDQGEQSGYWSYVGTDILTIPKRKPTLNLQGFTMQTPESEFHRVMRHETGHTLGIPHEHMRRELVNKIDRQKAIDYFGATQGWSPANRRHGKDKVSLKKIRWEPVGSFEPNL